MTRLRWILWLLFGSALVGCAAPAAPADAPAQAFHAGAASAWAMAYQVRIDPAFDADQVEAIASAAASWEAVVPVALDVVVATCSEGSAPAGVVCIRPTMEAVLRAAHDGVNVGAWTYYQQNSADVLAATDMPGGALYFQQALAHELGHAMGLVHTGPGTVMYAIHDADMASGPTSADAAQWAALRDLSLEATR